MTSNSPDQLAQIREATLGIEKLLDNDLQGAQELLRARPDSPGHGVGLGISCFLQAALGQEDNELAKALEVLVKAEGIAAAQSTSARKGEKSVFPPGLEYKILTHDAVMSQALVHILTESYLEFTKAIWKLNRAYKGFKSVYSIVYPGGITESDSLDTIFTKLNAHYVAQTTGAGSGSGGGSSLLSSVGGGGGGSSFFGWGKKKVSTTELKHSSSTAALPALSKVAALDAEKRSASAPGSKVPSREGSVFELGAGVDRLSMNGEAEKVGTGEKMQMGEDGSFPAPLWKDDPIASLCVSGAFFGAGLFTLIFSLLPPKMRKLISWFGFKESNRSVALKQLTVAAATGNDVHGYFASLTLLTFYCLVLLMSGWQCEEDYLLDQCTIVLNRVIERFPEGTLWVLNRAKLCRMRHDTASAISIIEAALEKGSSFREADSLLVFELSWCYLSAAEWIKAADSFERMCTLNNWSHSTYLAISSGCLIDLSIEQRTPEVEKRITDIFNKLPSLFGQKRLLGEPPTTEIFITRRLEADKAKHARWVAAGRLPKDSPFWKAIRITFAMVLGNFWASVGNRSPPPAMHHQIAHLSAFTPLPACLPSEATTGLATPAFTPPTVDSAALDLDTPDELAMRDILLGVLYRSLGTVVSFATAKSLLQSVVKRGRDLGAQGVKEEKWVVPFALFESAVVECKEGELAEKEVRLQGGAAKEVKKVWEARIKKAEKLLEEVFLVVEYDLKSRLESRVIMLRDEIAAKSKKLGL
ncbi:mitochondrial outer membrane protein IML2 [Leucosporidium creatinivorum]|uniref:Mitochondrial outer membrane protein IML2 n=1 Tax=Leucosporidium creatinivorum TaxID=106004 RepID=A0A1Y2G0P4_9BASI|nr:mitochondrial outer membrane protein IML2 [Leucosporidium creatinivorum]